MPRLVLHQGREDETVFPLHEGSNTIGRAETSDVFVLHKSLSRQHARIWLSGTEAFVEDLGSKNGTTVDGARITRQPLPGTHLIRCGDLEFAFVPDGVQMNQHMAAPSLIYDVEPTRRSALSSRPVTPPAGQTSRGCSRTRARSDHEGVPLRPERHTPTSLATARIVLLSAVVHFLIRCPLCKTHFLEYEREPGRHPCPIPRPPRGARRAA